jgi:hypothetical protein
MTATTDEVVETPIVQPAKIEDLYGGFAESKAESEEAWEQAEAVRQSILTQIDTINEKRDRSKVRFKIAVQRATTTLRTHRKRVVARMQELRGKRRGLRFNQLPYIHYDSYFWGMGRECHYLQEMTYTQLINHHNVISYFGPECATPREGPYSKVLPMSHDLLLKSLLPQQAAVAAGLSPKIHPWGVATLLGQRPRYVYHSQWITIRAFPRDLFADLDILSVAQFNELFSVVHCGYQHLQDPLV